MNRSVFKIIIFIIILFSFLHVEAYEICKPSEEYIRYMKLSPNERKKYIKPMYCEVANSEKISVFKSNKNVLKSKLLAYPTSYNAFDDNIVTEVKNQYSLGACWAFSALSNVETNALKNGLERYDFSEKHMIYSLLSAAYLDEEGKKGKYKVEDLDGGSLNYPATYFFNGLGQLTEEEMPYDKNGTKINSSDFIEGNRIISLSKFEIENMNSYSPCSDDEINKIKEAITKNGSAQANIYMDESLFKDTAKDYYITNLTNSVYPNHAVTIVGWDDNISKDKFNTTKDGAFLIKNSWGSSWSSDGLFYVSYNDYFVCKNNVFYSGVSNDTFDNTYKAADVVGMPEIVISGNTYIASKFKIQTDLEEEINRISFPVGPYIDYEIYLSKDNNLTSQNNWTLLSSGSSSNVAIDSVDLIDTVKVNNDFTIIIKYITQENKNSSIFSMCSGDEDLSDMEYSVNTNFLSTDGVSWYDMDEVEENVHCEPNIYVYTNNVEEESFIDIITKNVTNNVLKLSYESSSSSNDFSYKVLDNLGNDVTSSFTISNNNNSLVITSNNKISGNYKLIIDYLESQKIINFELKESISSIDSNYVIKNTDIMIKTDGSLIKLEDIINKIKLINTTIKIYNQNNNLLSDYSTSIGTNYRFKTNNNSYVIEILGDVNGDAKISALDYIEVKKHIMGTKITNHAKLIAADMDENSNITALDYIAIRKILMR